MVSKKTRNNRKRADIRLAIHLLSVSHANLTTSFNDALLTVLLKINDLSMEIEKLKNE